ncbi:hypothetical protein L1049_025539 [Liquidambar formosana]|uniref:Uncharacterized protein n=1 Tax=Liquidambar formosana TaxID=63359 RepID=A0AAP0ND07_LIQFO
MGSRGRPFFDLNEPPAEEDEERDGVFAIQPQKAVPSSHSQTSDLLPRSSGSERILNNHAFSHASSVSGFQPFVRPKNVHGPEECIEQKKSAYVNSKVASSSKSSNGEDMKASLLLDLGTAVAQAVEREEGEWSDAEGSADVMGSSSVHEQSMAGYVKPSQEQGVAEMMDHRASGLAAENISCNVRISESTKDENCSHALLGLDPDPQDYKSNSSRSSEGISKGDISMDGQEEPGLVPKQREVKGVEASHALRVANNLGKRHKLDQHKEAMLGKKRSRQTVFLKLEDVKHAGPIKTSTPRRQNFPSPITTRIVKENRAAPPPAERIGEKQSQSIIKDQKPVDMPFNEGSTTVESCEPKAESNGDLNSAAFS